MRAEAVPLRLTAAGHATRLRQMKRACQCYVIECEAWVLAPLRSLYTDIMDMGGAPSIKHTPASSLARLTMRLRGSLPGSLGCRVEFGWLRPGPFRADYIRVVAQVQHGWSSLDMVRQTSLGSVAVLLGPASGFLTHPNKRLAFLGYGGLCRIH